MAVCLVQVGLGAGRSRALVWRVPMRLCWLGGVVGSRMALCHGMSINVDIVRACSRCSVGLWLDDGLRRGCVAPWLGVEVEENHLVQEGLKAAAVAQSCCKV